jgi:hypothetical protein
MTTNGDEKKGWRQRRCWKKQSGILKA